MATRNPTARLVRSTCSVVLLGAMAMGCAAGTVGLLSAESPSSGPAGVPGSGGSGAAGSFGAGGTMGGTTAEAAHETAGNGANTTSPGAGIPATAYAR